MAMEGKGSAGFNPSDKLTPMKKGDYSIHILLEEGRGFVPLKEGDTIDPLVSFQVFGATKCSSAKKEVGTLSTVKWSDHFFFEKTNCTVEDVENANIIIELRDKRFLLADSLIGSYAMDLTYVYTQPKHALVHKWIALANAGNGDYASVKGYLKIGVAVLGEGDTQVDLCCAESGEIKDEDMLLPPQIQPKSCQVVIRAIKAEKLPKMDLFGTTDAFLDCEFGGNKVQSKTVKADEANFCSEWYQDLLLPAVIPTVSGKLRIRVYDEDTGKKNDLIGTFVVEFDDLLAEMKPDSKRRYYHYFWANIYGAPTKGTSGSFDDKMNLDPRLASYWRGRVLLYIRVLNVDKPRLMAQPIDPAEMPTLKQLIVEKYDSGDSYEARCQVFSGSNLPLEGKQLKIVVKWGYTEIASSLQQNVSGTCDWYETLKRREIVSPSDNFDDLPDLFVYLMQDDVIVSYMRLLPKDFRDVNCEAEWLQLIPDKSTRKVSNEWEAGFLRIRIYIGRLEDSTDISVGNWNYVKLPRPPQGNKLLVANLFQCRNLPSADSNGKADPYVVVKCGPNTAMTGKKDRMNNLNPMWYQPLVLPVSCSGKADAPPIVIQVWDYDTIGSDDLMGMYLARMTDASEDHMTFAKPRWCKLFMGMSSGLGEILISFNLINFSLKPYLFDIVPSCEEISVEINILGLRDLKPALGWVPVNKSYIIFDLSSLQMPGEGLNIKNVQTQPGEAGPNPNLNTIIKFTCLIPTDPLYSPALSCSVYDCLFMGMSQPLIGSFSINLGELYFKKNQSGFSLFGEALSKAKGFVVHHDPFQRSPPDYSEPASTNVSLFVQSEQQPRVKSQFEEKMMKAPEPAGAAGVRRGESEMMREDVSSAEARLGGFVRIPRYERNPRSGRMEELNPPDKNYFMQVGYDRVPGEGTMHYRYLLKTEMEKSKFMDPSPFDHYDIIRGQQVGVDSYFDLNSSESRVERVGKFKGLIRIVKTSEIEERKARMLAAKAQREELQKKIDSASDFRVAWKQYARDMEDLAAASADEEFEEIARRLLTPTRVVVRVYILDAFALAQRDIGSQSDPYVRIKLGSKVWYDEKENYQLDEPDPKIFKMFELETTLPGTSNLKIQFWDYDDIFSDDLIGSTAIDLEDRFFSSKWNNLKEKPIETRPLFIKTTKVPQGGVRLWIDIFPTSERADPLRRPRDITQRPPAEYEARLIVWGTDGVANYDDEGTSDIYVRVWINDSKPKETDTHFRCMTGHGSFNYRMKFPVTLTENKKMQATIQIWDRDLLSKNEFIADATLTFDSTARQAWELGGRVSRKGDGGGFGGKESDKFWIDCMRRRADGKMVHGGRVQISLELVPKAQAEACPVGEGRAEPNVDPFLPPPVGRFSWSWNPCKLLQQTVGPEYQFKAVMFCCLILCVVLCVFMLPMILSNIITNAAFALV